MIRSRLGISVVLLACLFAVLMFVTVKQISDLKSDLRASENARTVTEQNAEELAAELVELCLNMQVEDIEQCALDLQPASPGPAGETGDQGPQGEPGEPGEQGPPPTQQDVFNAVVEYCATTGNCEGKTPTLEQVRTAVVQYCASRDQCRGDQGSPGPTGDPGAPGENGSDGDTGPQGPGPTDEQIAAAVNDYCSNHNNCAGPQGEPGPEGPQGPPGSVTPGVYACPQGQFVGGITVSASGDVTLDCRNIV